MKLVDSLNELALPEINFPVFFRDAYLDQERSSSSHSSDVKLYFDDEAKAIVPFRLTKLKIIRKGDYLFPPVDLNGDQLDPAEEKGVLEKFHRKLREDNICDVIFPPGHYCTFSSFPDGTTYFRPGIIELDISGTEEDILGKMTANYRNEIRKIGKQENVVVSFGPEQFEPFFDLYRETHKRQSIHFDPPARLKAFTESDAEITLIGCLYVNGIAESAVYLLFGKDVAYYLYAGNSLKPSYPGLNKYLLKEAAGKLKRKGIRKLILGGYRPELPAENKLYGIQKFKLRFGAEIKYGYHFIKVLRPTRYFVFKFALKIKSVMSGKHLDLINLNGLSVKRS